MLWGREFPPAVNPSPGPFILPWASSINLCTCPGDGFSHCKCRAPWDKHQSVPWCCLISDWKNYLPGAPRRTPVMDAHPRCGWDSLSPGIASIGLACKHAYGEFSWPVTMWEDLGYLRKVAEQARDQASGPLWSLSCSCPQVPALHAYPTFSWQGLYCKLTLYSASQSMFYLSSKETD